MRRGVWNKTGSICDTGRGGNWPRGNVYGTILTLNGHNFYQNVDHDELTLSGKILEFQNIVEFVLLFFPWHPLKKSSWMMLSVLHFVMGGFLHEKSCNTKRLEH